MFHYHYHGVSQLPKAGFQRLRESQKFELFGIRGVRVKFGKYNGQSFKQISEEDFAYLDFLIDRFSGQMTAEVQKRLNYWREKSGEFFI